MTRIRRIVFFFALAVCACAVFAQNSVSLEAEIQNIERAVNVQGVAPAERHDFLIRLARLRQLSGDIEGAAKNWLEAAAAIPGNVDDDALLACAYCLAAMGEWDRASAALQPLLAKSSRARFLNTSVKAVKTRDISPLAALAGNPEYSPMKNEIYFMLWKTSSGASGETWRQRLITEFPQSPEGRLASGNASSAVAVRPSPFWLFMSGIDSSLFAEPETQARSPQEAAASPAPQTASVQPSVVQPVVQPSSASLRPSPAQSSQTAAVRLQTGLFRQETNAKTQAANLRQAGFSPSIEQRGEMWAVTVPAGEDSNRGIKELKDAGFDSFPIR